MAQWMCSSRSDKKKEGAALVESCLAIIMLCLILFGILQVSYLIMSRDVISFSAFAAARSLTVGMNEEFVERVGRTASIPTAGPMVTPSAVVNHNVLVGGSPGGMWDTALHEGPESDQFWEEHYWIGRYLFIDDDAERDMMLNYMNWLTSDTEISVQSSPPGSEEAEVTISQDVPLAFPFARAFFNDEIGNMVRRRDGNGAYEYVEVPLYQMEQTIRIENHSALYLTQ